MKYRLILILLTLIGIVLLIISSKHEKIYIGQQVEEMKSPAGPNSSGAFMHKANDGNVYLSWMEADGRNNTSLYFSILKHGEWSDAIQIASGKNWFVNYADFPSISTFGNNSLAAHNLQETPGSDFSYDVNLRLSNDGGSTWTSPFTPHRDNTPTEHGFVRMLPYEDNLLVVWLDGRNYSDDIVNNIPASEEMTLRSAVISKDGIISNEFLLDDRTCSCCQTDAAQTGDGAIVVYRDRTKNEIRNMSYVRFINGKWTEPKVLFDDDWMIPGCPVNGPAIDAKGSLVAVTWFTVSNDIPRTKFAFSENSGETFSEPILVSEGNTRGNVDVVLLNDGSAMVSWVERVNKITTLKIRRILRDGSVNEPITIARMDKKYIDGFPKMVLSNETLFFAWTEVGKRRDVKTAFLNLTQ